MNKSELVVKISEASGVNAADCEKVLDAFEKVLTNELSSSKTVGAAFDKVSKVINVFKAMKG